LKHTTTKENEVIKNLKMKNSHGYDEISMKIQKSAHLIFWPL